jgi:hypothetical protein
MRVPEVDLDAMSTRPQRKRPSPLESAVTLALLVALLWVQGAYLSDYAEPLPQQASDLDAVLAEQLHSPSALMAFDHGEHG